MRNVLLTGVGGQGTVLAAKVLAQAAQAKGWQVRTAETIGMAQRGGSVVSHVRMGDNGEEVIAPLVAKGTADMIIAFEPAEAARVLPYLAPDGVMVSATTSIQPITAALSTEPYLAEATIASLRGRLNGSAEAPPVSSSSMMRPCYPRWKIGRRSILCFLPLHLKRDICRFRSMICATRFAHA